MSLGIPSAIALLLLMALHGAFRESNEGGDFQGGIVVGTPTVIRALPMEDAARSRVDTSSPEGRGWITHLDRPVSAIRFVNPASKIVRKADCPVEIHPPMSWRDWLERIAHDRPRPALLVHQISGNRVEVEEINYRRKPMTVDLYYDPESLFAASE
jgi:hypothetical protein